MDVAHAMAHLFLQDLEIAKSYDFGLHIQAARFIFNIQQLKYIRQLTHQPNSGNAFHNVRKWDFFQHEL